MPSNGTPATDIRETFNFEKNFPMYRESRINNELCAVYLPVRQLNDAYNAHNVAGIGIDRCLAFSATNFFSLFSNIRQHTQTRTQKTSAASTSASSSHGRALHTYGRLTLMAYNVSLIFTHELKCETNMHVNIAVICGQRAKYMLVIWILYVIYWVAFHAFYESVITVLITVRYTLCPLNHFSNVFSISKKKITINTEPCDGVGGSLAEQPRREIAVTKGRVEGGYRFVGFNNRWATSTLVKHLFSSE